MNENLYELQREKEALKDVAADESAPEAVRAAAKTSASEISSQNEGLIAREGGLTAAKERFKADKAAAEHRVETDFGIDRTAVEGPLGNFAPAFREISETSDKLENLRDFEMQRMFEVKSDPYAKRAHQSLLDTARKERLGLESKLVKLSQENPVAARSRELVADAEGLRREGHIAPTASVKETLDKIGRNMQIGKPMFLHGPTGTGKTSLARYAAEHFTGQSAEMVYCNPQTRESSVWGKTGIRPAAGEAGRTGAIETVDIFGPLAKAMIEGKAVVFDEFSALPREQMVFIKGIFNARPGDEVNIVGNGKVKIVQGFQMIFTANLKSEKNPERQELPPEIAREFEQNNIKIGYQPKDEAYDIMLARLMKPDGSVDASWHDLYETMPKLCEAMEEIQTAYAGTTRAETARLVGASNIGGKVQSLKKFVMTQGTVEAMLQSWEVERQSSEHHVSFAEFIDQRLKIGLTFEEYPVEDRTLAAKILASKGFLRTLAPADLGLPADTFNFEAARKLRGDTTALKELSESSAREVNVPLKELAELDPFNVRKTSAEAAVAAELERLRLNKKGGRKGGKGGKGVEGAPAQEGETSFDEAKEIMGKNFFGPEEIKSAFELEFAGEIPPIPFPKERLEQLKDSCQLILWSDVLITQDNTVVEITGSSLYEYLGKKKEDGTPLLADIDWYKNEAFFTTEYPKLGWKLVSKDLIPNSMRKNYLDQTKVLADYAEALYPDADAIPADIKSAIAQARVFEADSGFRRKVESSDASVWKDAAKELADLPLNQMFRETFIEWFYRTALTEHATGDKLLPSTYSWTKSRSSGGALVGAGRFGGDGGGVSGWGPRGSGSGVGCAFSAEKL